MAEVICAENCETALPAVAFSDCAPEINLSEIGRVFIARANAAPFTNWLSPVEWATRLAQSGGSDDAIRALTVIADKPSPTNTPRQISGGREIVSTQTHVLNVTIDESNQENHDFVRAMECGGSFKVWYETLGGLLFGGNSGIQKATIRLAMVLNRGTEEIITYAGPITWKSKFTEERGISPIAGSGGGGNVNYDTTLTFAAAVEDEDAGVTGTVQAINATVQFEFNEIDPRLGTPSSMNILVNGVQMMVVDFLSDYAAQPFRYTHTTGATYSGTFASGNVNF